MKARYLRRIMDLFHQESDQEEDHNNNNNERSSSPSQPDQPDSSSEKRERTPPPSVVETKNATNNSPPPLDDEEDDMSSTEQTSSTNKPRKKSPIRYFVYALILWFLEFGTAIVLKKLGIQLEFNEQVVQSVFEQQFGRFNESMMPAALSYLTQEKKRPGFNLAQEGASHKYPVVLVHGFVTSGLEVWAGKECARPHFRQRFWAAMYGARSMLTDRDCWVEHMKLNPTTGGDPPGIRLRAATGFEAIDYFMANYWVFAKMIENLADLGYSPSDMAVESYDWRLGFKELEKRDGYFTSLKHRIETLHKTNGRKVVVTSHSMGVLVIHYFLAWVTTDESEGGGGGGKDWVDQHMHAYINLAGSHLGVPKAITSLLSGDLSDFVMDNPMTNIIEGFFGRRYRRDLWNTWGSVWMMLPKGPKSIWGVGADMCRNGTVDNEAEERNETALDKFCVDGVEAPMLVMSDVHNETVQVAVDSEDGDRNTTTLKPSVLSKQTHTATDTIDYIREYGGGYGKDMANAVEYSFYENDGFSNKVSPETWHDPTRTPLPYAPNLKIYCMYGVGLETERAYYYRRNVVNEGNESVLEEPPIVLDPSVKQPENDVYLGIRYTDGDGSVPLISLGYLCADAWQRESSGLNPSNIKVYTREYSHRSEFQVDDPVRGGRKSADHVDILGNVDMMEDLLRIVSDFEIEKVDENHIVSEIEKISQEINERGGIFQRTSENNKHKRKKWFNIL